MDLCERPCQEDEDTQAQDCSLQRRIQRRVRVRPRKDPVNWLSRRVIVLSSFSRQKRTRRKGKDRRYLCPRKEWIGKIKINLKRWFRLTWTIIKDCQMNINIKTLVMRKILKMQNSPKHHEQHDEMVLINVSNNIVVVWGCWNREKIKH